MNFMSSLTSLLTGPRDSSFVVSNTPGGASARAVAEAQSAARPREYPPDQDALFAAGEAMLAAARRHHQSLSLLVLQLPDLAELDLVFGRDAADKAIDGVLTQLTAICHRKGLLARPGTDTFALLMPGVSGEELHRALQRRLGKACSIEFEFDDEDILLVPEVLAHTIGPLESVREAYQGLCLLFERERHLRRRREDYLNRERESHAIRMELPRAMRQKKPVLPDEPVRDIYPTIPTTIPVPMAMR